MSFGRHRPRIFIRCSACFGTGCEARIDSETWWPCAIWVRCETGTHCAVCRGTGEIETLETVFVTPAERLAIVRIEREPEFSPIDGELRRV